MSDHIKLLKNYFLYILVCFLVCIIGISNVFAITYNNIGDVSNISFFLVSTDYGNTPFNVPKGTSYAFDEVTSIDIQVNNFNFIANTHYQLEIYLTRQLLSNANTYSVTGLNGESCLISYDSDKTNFRGNYPRWSFQCPHNTDTITIHLSNSSNNYLWSGTNVFTWNYSFLKSSTDPITSTSSNDSQNIIDNQNQNTQDIINNQNQNTQDIINSNKVCTYTKTNYQDFLNKGYRLVSGTLTTDSNYGVSDYIEVNSDSIIKVISSIGSSSANIEYYDSFKNFISSRPLSNLSVGTILDSIPSNAIYSRFSIYRTNYPVLEITTCKNGNQALDDSINNLDDTINDDDTTDAENEASEFFSSFNTETFGLTSIITAPLNLIRSIIDEGSVCTTLHLPLPYLDNKYLDLPCMYGIYSNYFGSFFTIYQTITYGIVAYWVIVRIFNQVKDFKNPEHDEIEVMDL